MFQECFDEVFFDKFVVAWISSQLPKQKEGFFLSNPLMEEGPDFGKTCIHAYQIHDYNTQLVFPPAPTVSACGKEKHFFSFSSHSTSGGLYWIG